MENISPTDTVLEVGCAHGQITASIARKVKQVTAIDIRPEIIEEAKLKVNCENVEFKAVDFMFLPEDVSYDVVVLSNVLEHIKHRGRFLRRAAQFGNKILIRVPSFDRDWIVAYRKKLGLEWRINKDHFIEYTENSLKEEIESCGLKILNITCKWGNYCCVAVV